MAPRLKLTSLLFKRPCFSCVNDVVLILTSRNLHKKSSFYQNEVNSSLTFIQRSLNYTHNWKWSTSFPGSSLFLAEESTWLRLVTCLLHFADSRKQKTEGRETMIKSLSPLNSFTEPGRKSQ